MVLGIWLSLFFALSYSFPTSRLPPFPYRITPHYVIKAPFVDALSTIAPTLKHRFFFPGHSSRYAPSKLTEKLHNISGIFTYDLPELDGLDNIHCPEGPLLEALQLAATYFKARKTWFLVNGCTSGIVTAVLACHRLHRQKPYFLLSRDCHKSVFDAVALTGCNAIILPCHIDSAFGISLGVDFSPLETVLQQYKGLIAGFVFTRPTYHGIACTPQTLVGIVEVCHTHSVPVVVDEAHGSHLHLLGIGAEALASGADIVVQSSHKTLTALSQTAMMHLHPEAFAYDVTLSMEAVEATIGRCFSMLTTTSPHALLLASLDATRAQIQDQGDVAMQQALVAVQELRTVCRKHRSSVQLLDDSVAVEALGLMVDPLRLSLRLIGRDSRTELDDPMCDEDGIYCELNQRDCISYNIPLFSTTETLAPLRDSLVRQLRRLDEGQHTLDDDGMESSSRGMPSVGEVAVVLALPPHSNIVSLPFAEAIGKVSADTVWLVNLINTLSDGGRVGVCVSSGNSSVD